MGVYNNIFSVSGPNVSYNCKLYKCTISCYIFHIVSCLQSSYKDYSEDLQRSNGALMKQLSICNTFPGSSSSTKAFASTLLLGITSSMEFLQSVRQFIYGSLANISSKSTLQRESFEGNISHSLMRSIR